MLALAEQSEAIPSGAGNPGSLTALALAKAPRGRGLLEQVHGGEDVDGKAVGGPTISNTARPCSIRRARLFNWGTVVVAAGLNLGGLREKKDAEVDMTWRSVEMR